MSDASLVNPGASLPFDEVLVDAGRIRKDGYLLGNEALPIALERSAIEDSIRHNAVTILVAPTGSGKTTQVPQYACELSHNGKPLFDEIIVTQPRIVAARTVSERIQSEITEMGQDYSAGYYTSKEGTYEPQENQDIAVLTDGKAAAQLLNKKTDQNDTAKRLLIIDEAHEWNLHIEMLVALARAKTDPSSPQYDKNLSVVIMSATMDGEHLKRYFDYCKPPLITVEVPTYEVTRSVSSDTVAQVALKLATETNGKVLAFHAGKREIAETIDTIENDQQWFDESERVVAVPLHGQQSADDQRKAFETYPKGSVVATTPVAETSLTVPDAVVVVDSGEMRTDMMRYDIVPTGSNGLYLINAPQSSLNQRAGRVGRTGPGQYILAPQRGENEPLSYEARREYGVPAIQRTSLDGMLLQLKASGYEPADFTYFHEPPTRALEAAEQRLKNLGALDEHGRITDRGIKMGQLPLEPEHACMLVFAWENGYSAEVRQYVFDIVTIMQRGGILKRSYQEQRWRNLLEKDNNGELLEKESDLIAQLEAYNKLVNYVPRDKWEDYDVIEYTADLVQQSRESLARTMKIALHPIAAVEPKNRHAVLTCIHAGQINQIWQRNSDEKWQLFNGADEGYEFSKSTVAASVGQLVTGSMFTIGAVGKYVDMIQNVSHILDNGMLEKAAAHLVTETYSNESAVFDPKRSALVVTVQRKLGPLVLRTFTREIDAELGSVEIDQLRSGYNDHAWNEWVGRKAQRTEYTTETISAALQEPEAMQYGTDPVTGEPLYAYKGGKGQWVRTKVVALESLVARQAELAKQPKKAQLREIKAQVKVARSKLIALGKDPKNTIPQTILRSTLLAAENTQEWLDAVIDLLNPTQP